MEKRSVPLILAATLTTLAAQPVFRGSEIFPADEFAARRARVVEKIGDEVAIVLGTSEPPGEMPFRQNSQFFYLSGVAEPRAVVIIDGRTKTTTLFLAPKNDRREQSMFGPALSPGPEAVTDTGIADIRPRDALTAALDQITKDHRTVFTPFAAEVLGSQSQGDPTRMWAANKRDPWDGRDSREQTFIAKLKATSPDLEVKDLDPIVNALRAVKSPREIEVIREATRIAGLASWRRRDARPGMHEYELQADAEYVFKKNGALGASYFALIATGPNTYYTHYNKNTATLKDGELIQFDYAPDFKYYQSDVTRVFPANGKFTPRQRDYYGIYLKLYQALMTSIQVHMTPKDVTVEAVKKMDAIMASYRSPIPRSRRRDVRRDVPQLPRRRPRSQRRARGARRRRAAGADVRAGPHLHDRAGNAPRGRAPGRAPRGHDPDHRARLREPVRVRADRDHRHREAHGRARPERRAGAHQEVARAARRAVPLHTSRARRTASRGRRPQPRLLKPRRRRDDLVGHHEIWTPLDYVTSASFLISRRLQLAPPWLFPALAAWTLFLWIGVAMSARRAIGGAIGVARGALLRAAVNYALMVSLCVAPSSGSSPAPANGPKVGALAAVVSAAARAVVGIAMIVVSVTVAHDGTALFFGAPFVMTR